MAPASPAPFSRTGVSDAAFRQSFPRLPRNLKRIGRVCGRHGGVSQAQPSTGMAPGCALIFKLLPRARKHTIIAAHQLIDAPQPRISLFRLRNRKISMLIVVLSPWRIRHDHLLRRPARYLVRWRSREPRQRPCWPGAILDGSPCIPIGVLGRHSLVCLQASLGGFRSLIPRRLKLKQAGCRLLGTRNARGHL